MGLLNALLTHYSVLCVSFLVVTIFEFSFVCKKQPFLTIILFALLFSILLSAIYTDGFAKCATQFTVQRALYLYTSPLADRPQKAGPCDARQGPQHPVLTLTRCHLKK